MENADEKRNEFLMKMYDQMFNDIDRHHKLVWEVIGVLVAAFAVFALTEKKVLSLDVATTLIIILGGWVLAHVYDSNYWYNRNLVIISNIERQFLKQSDLKDIHYYFGKHRDANSIQTSLKIQLYFGWALITIFLLVHFIERIITGFTWEVSWQNLSFMRFLPYLSVVIVYFLFVKSIKEKRIKDYGEFLKNSPGISIDTTGINYGSGHPIGQAQNSRRSIWRLP